MRGFRRRAMGIPSPYMGGRIGMTNLAGRTRNMALVASGMRRMYGKGWMDTIKNLAKSAYSGAKKVVDDNPFIKQGLKDVAKTGIEFGTRKLAEKYGNPQVETPAAPAARAKVKDVSVKQKGKVMKPSTAPPSKKSKSKSAPAPVAKKAPAAQVVSTKKAGPAVRLSKTNPVTSMFRAGSIMRGPIP